MQNPVLKLTALAGVIGIGFLVVYHAQKGMMYPNQEVDAKAAFEELATGSVERGGSDAPPPAQTEPFASHGAAASTGQANNSSFGAEPTLADPAGSSGLSFEEKTPAPESDPIAGQQARAELTKAGEKIANGHLSPIPDNDVPKTAASESPQPKSTEPFEPFPFDAKSDPASAQETHAKDTKGLAAAGAPQPAGAVEPAGFDVAASESGSSSEAQKNDEPAKTSQDGGPQLFSASPEPAPANASTNASDQPEIFPGVTGQDLQPVPRKGVQTVGNTSETDMFGDAADPSASTGTPKKTDDEPNLLDNDKSPSSSSVELENKPVDSGGNQESAAKAEEPAPLLTAQPSPELVPQEDAFPAQTPVPAAEPTQIPVDDKQDAFGADASSGPARARVDAEPALPDPTRVDPFGTQSTQPGAPVSQSDGKAPHETASEQLTPDKPISGQDTPSEATPPGTHLNQSEPTPVEAQPEAAAPLKSAPSTAHEVPQDAFDAPSRRAIETAPPRVKLPLIRPRPLKPGAGHPADSSYRTSESDQQSTNSHQNSGSAGPSTAEAAAPRPLTPSPNARPAGTPSQDVFNGDGTIQENSPHGPQQPRLVLTKSAPPNAAIGQPLIYSILVQNAGDSPARDVVVQDRIPRGTQLKGTIPRAELIDRRLVWKLGTLEPGARQKISIRVVPTEEGVVGSVATVTFAAEVAARTVITSPKISVGMEAPPRASVGENITFRFKVANRGNADAANVVLRDILPEGLRHAAGKELEFAVGTLPAGTSRDVDLTLTAAESGEMVNRAVVTTADGVSVEAKAAITIDEPQLLLSRSGPKQRYVGRDASYTNTLSNQGRTAVVGVSVFETVPHGMDFVEASDGGQYDETTRRIAWRVPQLAPGASQELHVKLVSRDTGKMSSSVMAMDQNGRKVEATSETTISGFAAVSLDVPEHPGAVEIGESVTLRIIVSNRGSSQATNVALRMSIPDELELASVNGPVKYQRNGEHLDFSPVSAIDANAPATFEVAFKARRSGDARIGLQIVAEQLSKPLTREEAIVVLGEGQ